MPAKRVTRIGGPPQKILGKPELRAQSFTGCNRLRLPAFCFPDGLSDGENFFGGAARRENAAVIIGENYVFPGHIQITNMGRDESILFGRVEPLRTRGARPVAEYWQPDLPEFRCVTVSAPDDDAGQSAAQCFKRYQITDAAFVGSSPVINYENITWA